MKKGYTFALVGCLLAFYIGIIMYAFFEVLHIPEYTNFVSALVFEMIGFLILAYVILGNILSRRIKIGFWIPLIMITVVYSIILDVINMVYINAVKSSLFILLQLVLLFVYCLLSIPVYIMGRK